MIELRDNLEKRDILVTDDMFMNAIIASIPDIFKPTVNALVVYSAREKDKTKKVTPAELIATIRAEAMGYATKRNESTNYAGNSSNRGRGNF